MLDRDDSYCALVINNIFKILIYFEITPKFELLEDSMYKDLILFVEAIMYKYLKFFKLRYVNIAKVLLLNS